MTQWFLRQIQNIDYNSKSVVYNFLSKSCLPKATTLQTTLCTQFFK